jgi:intracellular septation protein A
MAEGGLAEKGMRLARYRRQFALGDLACEATCESRMSGLHSELFVSGAKVAEDHTPPTGTEAIRNHLLTATLPDGTSIQVELGYINWLTVGIAVRRDGALVYESHPGRRIAYPKSAAKMAIAQGDAADGVDLSQFRRNRVPIAVDIALGLLFFIVAKATDLSTAAIVGAVVGLGLVVVQRFVKVDLIGGLALFGVVMLLLSAALAIVFQDDMAVKMRGTILGVISAVLFLGDGLLGGNRLGKGMARYLPYTDIDPGRLAIGMGLLGLVMAGLNLLVAKFASTDLWLFYSTFVDFALIMVLILFVFRYARGQPVLGGRRLAPESQGGNGR